MLAPMPTIEDLHTPALLVDADVFEHNLTTMAHALPGIRCRPHVKAHKSTAIARRQADIGHLAFTAATPREVEGLAHAGLGEDILLANETVDDERLKRLARLHTMVTVAVDSDATIDAAARAGIGSVVIDVNIGLPRCGCHPDGAGRLADRARRAGLEVRGVMGYEGHVVGLEDRAERQRLTEECMQLLVTAHEQVGGNVISAGGTGTYDLNVWASEIQAGSYILMDTSYAKLDLPFRQALSILATVVSVSDDGYAVADCGLKSLGMDHGNPSIDAGEVWFCSDEHLTFAPTSSVAVGDRIRVWPAHVDPTVAYHERMYVVGSGSSEGDVIDTWAIDLRGW